MATIQYRRGTNKVYVYYYHRTLRRTVQVSRDKTRHLDGRPRSEVEDWVRRWEAEHGLGKDRVARVALAEDDPLAVLWAAYQTARKVRRGGRRRAVTVRDETRNWTKYVLRYFVTEHGLKDPTRWHDRVPDFHEWLATQIGPRAQQKVLWLLERFGHYLVFRRKMPYPYAVQTPSSENTKFTPLKSRLTPAEVLAWVRQFTGQRTRKRGKRVVREAIPVRLDLMALLLYFGRLRPEEVDALTRDDFLTGAAARKLAKTHEGLAKHGLGSGLSVIVNKSVVDGKVVPEVKTAESEAVVNIWDVEAAREIARILKELPAGRLFPMSRAAHDRLWRDHVASQLKTSRHDMGRTATLYMGRVLRLPLTLVQDHGRWTEAETVLLYMREPRTPEQLPAGHQNFDDVG